MKSSKKTKPEFLPGNISYWTKKKSMELDKSKTASFSESLIYQTNKMIPVRGIKPISKQINYDQWK